MATTEVESAEAVPLSTMQKIGVEDKEMLTAEYDQSADKLSKDELKTIEIELTKALETAEQSGDGDTETLQVQKAFAESHVVTPFTESHADTEGGIFVITPFEESHVDTVNAEKNELSVNVNVEELEESRIVDEESEEIEEKKEAVSCLDDVDIWKSEDSVPVNQKDEEALIDVKGELEKTLDSKAEDISIPENQAEVLQEPESVPTAPCKEEILEVSDGSEDLQEIKGTDIVEFSSASKEENDDTEREKPVEDSIDHEVPDKVQEPENSAHIQAEEPTTDSIKVEEQIIDSICKGEDESGQANPLNDDPQVERLEIPSDIVPGKVEEAEPSDIADKTIQEVEEENVINEQLTKGEDAILNELTSTNTMGTTQLNLKETYDVEVQNLIREGLKEVSEDTLSAESEKKKIDEIPTDTHERPADDVSVPEKEEEADKVLPTEITEKETEEPILEAETSHLQSAELEKNVKADTTHTNIVKDGEPVQEAETSNLQSAELEKTEEADTTQTNIEKDEEIEEADIVQVDDKPRDVAGVHITSDPSEVDILLAESFTGEVNEQTYEGKNDEEPSPTSNIEQLLQEQEIKSEKREAINEEVKDELASTSIEDSVNERTIIGGHLLIESHEDVTTVSLDDEKVDSNKNETSEQFITELSQIEEGPEKCNSHDDKAEVMVPESSVNPTSENHGVVASEDGVRISTNEQEADKVEEQGTDIKVLMDKETDEAYDAQVTEETRDVKEAHLNEGSREVDISPVESLISEVNDEEPSPTSNAEPLPREEETTSETREAINEEVNVERTSDSIDDNVKEDSNTVGQENDILSESHEEDVTALDDKNVDSNKKEISDQVIKEITEIKEEPEENTSQNDKPELETPESSSNSTHDKPEEVSSHRVDGLTTTTNEELGGKIEEQSSNTTEYNRASDTESAREKETIENSGIAESETLEKDAKVQEILSTDEILTETHEEVTDDADKMELLEKHKDEEPAELSVTKDSSEQLLPIEITKRETSQEEEDEEKPGHTDETPDVVEQPLVVTPTELKEDEPEKCEDVSVSVEEPVEIVKHIVEPDKEDPRSELKMQSLAEELPVASPGDASIDASDAVENVGTGSVEGKIIDKSDNELVVDELIVSESQTQSQEQEEVSAQEVETSMEVASGSNPGDSANLKVSEHDPEQINNAPEIQEHVPVVTPAEIKEDAPGKDEDKSVYLSVEETVEKVEHMVETEKENTTSECEIEGVAEHLTEVSQRDTIVSVSDPAEVVTENVEGKSIEETIEESAVENATKLDELVVLEAGIQKYDVVEVPTVVEEVDETPSPDQRKNKVETSLEVVSEPDPDESENLEQLSEPDPDDSHKLKQISEPDPDDSEILENVSKQDPDGNEKLTQVSEPDPDDSGNLDHISEPDPDDSENIEKVSQPDPVDTVILERFSEQEPDENENLIRVSEPDPDDSENLKNVSEPDHDDNETLKKVSEPVLDDTNIQEKLSEPDLDDSENLKNSSEPGPDKSENRDKVDKTEIPEEFVELTNKEYPIATNVEVPEKTADEKSIEAVDSDEVSTASEVRQTVSRSIEVIPATDAAPELSVKDSVNEKSQIEELRTEEEPEHTEKAGQTTQGLETVSRSIEVIPATDAAPEMSVKDSGNEESPIQEIRTEEESEHTEPAGQTTRGQETVSGSIEVIPATDAAPELSVKDSVNEESQIQELRTEEESEHTKIAGQTTQGQETVSRSFEVIPVTDAAQELSVKDSVNEESQIQELRTEEESEDTDIAQHNRIADQTTQIQETDIEHVEESSSSEEVSTVQHDGAKVEIQTYEVSEELITKDIEGDEELSPPTDASARGSELDHNQGEEIEQLTSKSVETGMAATYSVNDENINVLKSEEDKQKDEATDENIEAATDVLEPENEQELKINEPNETEDTEKFTSSVSDEVGKKNDQPKEVENVEEKLTADKVAEQENDKLQQEDNEPPASDLNDEDTTILKKGPEEVQEELSVENQPKDDDSVTEREILKEAIMQEDEQGNDEHELKINEPNETEDTEQFTSSVSDEVGKKNEQPKEVENVEEKLTADKVAEQEDDELQQEDNEPPASDLNDEDTTILKKSPEEVQEELSVENQPKDDDNVRESEILKEAIVQEDEQGNDEHELKINEPNETEDTEQFTSSVSDEVGKKNDQIKEVENVEEKLTADEVAEQEEDELQQEDNEPSASDLNDEDTTLLRKSPEEVQEELTVENQPKDDEGVRESEILKEAIVQEDEQGDDEQELKINEPDETEDTELFASNASDEARKKNDQPKKVENVEEKLNADEVAEQESDELRQEDNEPPASDLNDEDTTILRKSPEEVQEEMSVENQPKDDDSVAESEILKEAIVQEDEQGDDDTNFREKFSEPDPDDSENLKKVSESVPDDSANQDNVEKPEAPKECDELTNKEFPVVKNVDVTDEQPKETEVSGEANASSVEEDTISRSIEVITPTNTVPGLSVEEDSSSHIPELITEEEEIENVAGNVNEVDSDILDTCCKEDDEEILEDQQKDDASANNKEAAAKVLEPEDEEEGTENVPNKTDDTELLTSSANDEDKQEEKDQLIKEENAEEMLTPDEIDVQEEDVSQPDQIPNESKSKDNELSASNLIDEDTTILEREKGREELLEEPSVENQPKDDDSVMESEISKEALVQQDERGEEGVHMPSEAEDTEIPASSINTDNFTALKTEEVQEEEREKDQLKENETFKEIETATEVIVQEDKQEAQLKHLQSDDQEADPSAPGVNIDENDIPENDVDPEKILEVDQAKDEDGKEIETTKEVLEQESENVQEEEKEKDQPKENETFKEIETAVQEDKQEAHLKHLQSEDQEADPSAPGVNIDEIDIPENDVASEKILKEDQAKDEDGKEIETTKEVLEQESEGVEVKHLPTESGEAQPSGEDERTTVLKSEDEPEEILQEERKIDLVKVDTEDQENEKERPEQISDETGNLASSVSYASDKKQASLTNDEVYGEQEALEEESKNDKTEIDENEQKEIVNEELVLEDVQGEDAKNEPFASVGTDYGITTLKSKESPEDVQKTGAEDDGETKLPENANETLIEGIPIEKKEIDLPNKIVEPEPNASADTLVIVRKEMETDGAVKDQVTDDKMNTNELSVDEGKKGDELEHLEKETEGIDVEERIEEIGEVINEKDPSNEEAESQESKENLEFKEPGRVEDGEKNEDSATEGGKYPGTLEDKVETSIQEDEQIKTVDEEAAPNDDTEITKELLETSSLTDTDRNVTVSEAIPAAEEKSSDQDRECLTETNDANELENLASVEVSNTEVQNNWVETAKESQGETLESIIPVAAEEDINMETQGEKLRGSEGNDENQNASEFLTTNSDDKSLQTMETVEVPTPAADNQVDVSLKETVDEVPQESLVLQEENTLGYEEQNELTESETFNDELKEQRGQEKYTENITLASKTEERHDDSSSDMVIEAVKLEEPEANSALVRDGTNEEVAHIELDNEDNKGESETKIETPSDISEKVEVKEARCPETPTISPADDKQEIYQFIKTEVLGEIAEEKKASSESLQVSTREIYAADGQQVNETQPEELIKEVPHPEDKMEEIKEAEATKYEGVVKYDDIKNLNTTDIDGYKLEEHRVDEADGSKTTDAEIEVNLTDKEALQIAETTSEQVEISGIPKDTPNTNVLKTGESEDATDESKPVECKSIDGCIYEITSKDSNVQVEMKDGTKPSSETEILSTIRGSKDEDLEYQKQVTPQNKISNVQGEGNDNNLAIPQIEQTMNEVVLVKDTYAEAISKDDLPPVSSEIQQSKARSLDCTEVVQSENAKITETPIPSMIPAENSLSDLLLISTKDTIQMNQQPIQETKKDNTQPEDPKTDEDKDDEEDDEHKKTDSSSDGVIVEASRDMDVKSPQKKHHGILSGVGTKVKNSISKVKKAITGKSSHPKPPSPK